MVLYNYGSGRGSGIGSGGSVRGLGSVKNWCHDIVSDIVSLICSFPKRCMPIYVGIALILICLYNLR